MTRGLGRFMRQNVIALLALFIALGGTSAFAAATLINGKSIKPHTIAKNRLTNTAIKQLRGNRGPQGPAGAAGARGPTGAQGIQGVVGPPGISQLDAVRSGSVPIAANSYSGFVLATCPNGEIVTGGGTYGALVADKVVVSVPYNTSTGFSGRPNAWGGGVVAGGSASSMEVFAMCAPSSSGTPLRPTHQALAPTLR